MEKSAENAGSDLQKDIMKMAVLFALRGNSVSKIYEKSSKGKDEIKRLIDTYNLVDHAKQGSTQVSLARVSIIAPHIVAQALAVGAGRGVVRNYTGLPIYLQFSAGATLIKKSDQSGFENFVKWSIESDKILNSSHDSKVVFDAKREIVVRQYAEVSWHSSFYSDDFIDKTIATCQKLMSQEIQSSNNEEASSEQGGKSSANSSGLSGNSGQRGLRPRGNPVESSN
jgi:hypothetical protein